MDPFTSQNIWPNDVVCSHKKKTVWPNDVVCSHHKLYGLMRQCVFVKRQTNRVKSAYLNIRAYISFPFSLTSWLLFTALLTATLKKFLKPHSNSRSVSKSKSNIDSLLFTTLTPRIDSELGLSIRYLFAGRFTNVVSK